ncbi:MAG: NAD-binding protein [Chitinophagaceae bacterium]|nr:NAD-binding protein [Chitinophagaceae bacterium]
MRFRFINHPFFRIFEVFLVFVVMVIFGTAGYMLIENYTWIEAVYMTVITIATVGFEEVHPLSPHGMIFTIILIMVTVIAISFSLAYITRYLLDGQFQRNYKLYNMKNKIKHLSNHVILCGYGRNGQSAFEILHMSKTPVVIIEKNAELIENAGRSIDYFLVGDATEDEVLTHAGILQAQALIITLPNDADNVFIVLTAKALNPKLKIITRASSDTSVSKMKIAGAANVIMPDKIGGTHMATLVVNPDVKEFLDYLSTQNSEDFQIAEIMVKHKCMLSEIDGWKNTGATILGIKNISGEYLLNPSPSVIVTISDRLITMGSKEQLNRMEQLFR